MKSIAYKIIHADTNNELRNYSYTQISESMKDFSKLESDTIFLKTKEECISFLDQNKSFKINTIKNYTGEGTIFPPRAGVIGIIASNYLAYKEFLKTDKDILIIFEDDVTVSKNISYFINKYVQELPEDWDVFSFYIPDDIKNFYNPSVHEIAGKEFVCKSYTNHCCAAYMMNRKSVEKAVKDIEENGISAPIDWYVLNVKHLGNEPTIFNVYCLKPNIYLPVKEIAEEYFSSTAHYGKTEEFLLPKDTLILDNKDLINKFISIQKIIKPNISIEVGSFEASFSKLMTEIIPEGNIWAFEASPYVYNNFNPIEKVNYINKAVSDKNGNIKFEIQSDFNRVIGNNSIIHRNENKNYEYINVESITLDSMFSEYSNICLWIDCEGAAKQVFNGARNMIKNVSSIFIEVEEVQFWENQWLFNDVYSYLINNNFILLNKDQEYGNSQYNCIFIKKDLEELINNVTI